MALEKNGNKVRTISMPKELWDRLKELADRERRSVNGQVIFLVEEATKADA